jgi:Fe-S-cluster containining protein
VTKIYTLKEIRERESDPGLDKRATERADAIDVAFRARGGHVDRLFRRANSEVTFKRKLTHLREVAAILADAARGNVACGQGCSECCNQPLYIPEAEAQVIAEETGAPLAKPPATAYRNGANGGQEDRTFIGVPCVFLKNNACSIYDSRPMLCRLHYSVDVDNMLCAMNDEHGNHIVTKVPFFNAQGLSFNMIAVSGGAAFARTFADLRYFFPKGLCHDEQE